MDMPAILSGFGVGAIVGLTGVGGGSLMTPLLMGAFGLPAARAIGTDLWFAAVTKSGGAWAHHRHGHVDYRITGHLLAGSLPAAAATIAWLYFSDSAKREGGMLMTVLGVALLLTAMTLVCRRAWVRLALHLDRRIPVARKPLLTVLAGGLLGILVSLTSIGAGALGAALILLLYPHLPAQRLVGTDIAHAVPLTLVAGLGHASLGHVDWNLLAALLVGSLPGIWLGARLSGVLPQAWVRTLLCVSLFTAGLKVIH